MLDSVLSQLIKNNPEGLRVVFRNFPLLEIHPNALLATQAAEAAGKQDRQMFFALGERLFQNQSAWSSMTSDQFKDWLVTQAEELGLDVARFNADMVSSEMVEIAKSAHDDAVKMGITGTPFVLINGVPYPGSSDYTTLDAIIKLFNIQDRQYAQCPPITLDKSRQYRATLRTSKGDIVIKLFPKEAPLAVNSFIFLARNGWFDNGIFHSVDREVAAQSGDPTGTGFGYPGYFFGNEIDPSLKFDKPGVVAMANAGENSNGSQFFITYDALPKLDGRYTIFGQVTEGMEVAESLNEVSGSQDANIASADKILSVSIEEK